MEIRKSIAKNIHVNRGDSGSTRINKVVTSVNEEVDGGEELNDALNIIETAKKPIDDVGGEIKERVKNKVVDKVLGEDESISKGTRKTTKKTARETTKKTGKESAKQTAKESGKKAAKETTKTKEIVLAELLFDTSSAVDVDRRDIGKLYSTIEKYPIQYFVVFSPDDITDDLDDLIEFAYLLGTLGAKILSIDDDEIVTYEILKQIKSELEEDTKEADNHEV